MAVEISGIQYDSPLPFTAPQRFILNIGAPLIASSLRLLSYTCRYELAGREYWKDVQQTCGRAIVALWHETTTLAAYHYRNTGIHTLASYSLDAEWAARTLRHLGILSIRGSSSNGGGKALRDLAVALEQQSTVVLTVDGPRGPRRVAKAGAAILAARTGTPIIPHAFAVRSAWHMRFWDRFSIVKPFARVISGYAPAIPPPPNTSPAAIEETRLQVEASLNQVQQQLEARLCIGDDVPNPEHEHAVYDGEPSKR